MSSTVKTFADFDVDSRITQALSDQGITTPFPIQELTLPLALSGADLIGQARTGTGKTLAFGLPLLQRVDTSSNATQALIIVPTRELCLQVHDDLVAAGTHKGVRVVAAYGGRAIDPQSQAIAEGAEVVVGTPGRLLDLMRRGLLQLSTVSTLVLDEADEMLDMGFLPDVEQLIEACADERQTLLFSATMPAEVVALARRYMRKPTFMRADVEESRIAPETRQHFFAVHRMDKPALVARILRTPERGRCVIFTRTKRMADMLVSDLRDAGLNAAAIHSDLRQEARERTLARFRTGQVDVMCATEVAARGLDIDEVTHVINYDCPDDEKMYLHRIGRTGRAGAEGVAVTLAIWSELARLDMIKKALDVSEPTLEVFSTSDVLDELFPLAPEGTAEAAAGPEVAPERTSKSSSERSSERSRDRDPESGDDRSGQRTGSGSSRRRRRGGRGRSRPADAAPAGSGGAPRAGAEDVDAGSDAPAAVSADAGAEAPEAGRSDTRRPAADRPKAAAAPSRGPDGSPASSGPEPLRRTRRRTRTVRSQTGADSGGDDADAGAADQQPAEQRSRRSADGQTRPDGAGTRRRERTRTSQPRGDRGTQSQSSDEPATASTASPRGQSRGGGAKQQGGGRGGRRGGRQSSAGRGRRRSEPSRGSGSGSPEGDPRPVGAPAGAVAAADARGEGRPGLRRLVQIDHLP